MKFGRVMTFIRMALSVMKTAPHCRAPLIGGYSLLFVAFCASAVDACTNILVSRGASTDGRVELRHSTHIKMHAAIAGHECDADCSTRPPRSTSLEMHAHRLQRGQRFSLWIPRVQPPYSRRCLRSDEHHATTPRDSSAPRETRRMHVARNLPPGWVCGSA